MAKERRSNVVPVCIWVVLTGLLSQNLVISAMSTSFEEQKNYYSPDPHGGTPPTGSHHGSPHHGSNPPSHGGSYNPTPSTPSGGNCGTPPHGSTPTTPPTPSGGGGGGGYYHSPPTSGSISPPTPVIVSPPTAPTTPTTPTPTPTIPSPPYFPDPNSFPGTCNYWRSHPGLIWGVLGWWGTVGNAFGVTSLPGFGANMSLQEALSNTHTNGLGALYREGTASWLNSMVNRRFPFTTQQVRDSFLSALHSDKAAAAQAQLFKLANEGHLKPRD